MSYNGTPGVAEDFLKKSPAGESAMKLSEAFVTSTGRSHF